MKSGLNKGILSTIVIILLLGTTAGCQRARQRREPPPSAESLASCMKPDAVVQLGDREKDQCASLMERFLEASPEDPLADRASIQLGRYYLEKGDFSAAYHLFSLHQEQYPKSSQRMLAWLYQGICMYYLDDVKGSLELLHALADEAEGEPFAPEVYRYLAENYVKLDNLLSALAWYQRSDASMKDEAGKESLQRRILEVASQGWEQEVLQRAAEVFPEGFYSDVVRFGVAATCMRKGQLRIAQTTLYRMAERHPDDMFTPWITALLERISSERLPHVCTVGCLLPLTGKYGRYGNSVLDALLLAVRAFRNSEDEGGSVRLLIRDTEGDPEVALEQLKDLAREPEIVGIIGPLLVKTAKPCASEAQKVRIPMIALTQREDVAHVGDYIFQNGLTMRQQVETLVDYVMDSLGLSTFSILHPDDAYGKLAKRLFEEKVLEMGGDVFSSVSYPDQETDFQDEIKSLVGVAYWDEMKRREEERKNRKGNLQGLAEGEEADPDDPSGDKKGPDEAFWDEEEEEEPFLPPFEALFVPDNYRTVALIAPHLAFYDLNEIVLMGSSAWNSSHLLEEAGEYVRDAVFVDGFFLESAMPHVKDFVEEFTRAFQKEPRVLEAQGYDSLMMLEEAFHQASPKTRGGIRDALEGTEGYPGLSGYTRFDADGCAVKRLYLLSVIQNRIQQIY